MDGRGPLVHGDVVRRRDAEVTIHNLLQGRDTLIALRDGATLNTLASAGKLIPLRQVTTPLDTALLTRRPFTYRYGGATYWASFEPVFTGFPEYARRGARDFVNRMTDWRANGPGLQYSEYSLALTGPQPVLVLGERRRGQYLENAIVLVDSIGATGFAGRLIEKDQVHPVRFEQLPEAPVEYTAEAFVDEVNAGYSRSYLLAPLEEDQEGSTAVEVNRLPRRSTIDPGDLGNISASFLDDGTLMFLSNDHIVLQGSYVLDLDRGLLTVSDDTDADYRVFVDTRDGIAFTLPVSVVELVGSRLVGQDNYLRIEVAAP
ncbi:hypothetical protein [Neolewinella sp.]|uniref:hypothetical protein n=1 Tax=Neolewinella sp. TaxID=2993543 RepID=UPI003B520D32